MFPPLLLFPTTAPAAAAGVVGSGAVRVEAVELRRVRLPLVRPFTTAAGSSSARTSLLVRLLTDGPDGWGECVALDEPLYTAEYVEAAHH